MMTATTYTIGQTVHHARFGPGTIIAMDDRNITIKYADAIRSTIAAFASFVNAGSAPATPETIDSNYSQARKERAEKKQRRLQREAAARAQYDSLPTAKKLEQMFLSTGSLIAGDRNSMSWKLIDEKLMEVLEVAERKGDTFVVDVIGTVRRTMRCSPKQAHIIASFGDNNDIQA